MYIIKNGWEKEERRLLGMGKLSLFRARFTPTSHGVRCDSIYIIIYIYTLVCTYISIYLSFSPLPSSSSSCSHHPRHH